MYGLTDKQMKEVFNYMYKKHILELIEGMLAVQDYGDVPSEDVLENVSFETLAEDLAKYQIEIYDLDVLQNYIEMAIYESDWYKGLTEDDLEEMQYRMM